MFPFAVGATVGLFSERPTPESLALAIEMYRPTWSSTNVPTMLGKLLDHDQARRDSGKPGLDLSSVRFSLSAGEALPEPLLRRWLERFGSDVYDGIGSAEMFHIYASNRPGDIKPGSLGRVVAGYELRILPEDAEGPGAATAAAPGEIGVLWVKGDSVSHGYWLDRDKSWRVFHGHWCRTGDLFRIDAEGYLYFAGRADELLKVSGLWVAPVEVEECLMRHGHVLHAAVIGIEDEGLVKTKAFVLLRGRRGRERGARLRPAGGVREAAPREAQVPARPRVRGRSAQERPRQGGPQAAARAREAHVKLLGDLTTDEVRALVGKPPTAVLVPVGSVEPHGPHLPLGTDTVGTSADRGGAGVRRARCSRSRGRRRARRPVRGHRLRRGFRGSGERPGRGAHAAAPGGLPLRLLADAGWTPRLPRQQPPLRTGARRRRACGGRVALRASVASPLSTRRWRADPERRVQARRLPRGPLRDVADAGSGSSASRTSTRRSPRSG